MSPQQPRPAKVIFLLLLLTTIAVHAKAKAGSLTCTWKDNSTNEDGFLIERERQKKGKIKFIEIATVGANIDSYMDTGIEGEATYCYRVRAFNKFGSSAYTNEAYGTYELVANARQNAKHSVI